MAAGRYVGYRDHEFRSRESDIEVFRREDSYKDRYRNGDGLRSRGRDLRDRVRDRQRDIKARESMNGYHRSLFSRSGQKVSRFSWSLVDFEPIEMSGSGSGDLEFAKLENGDLPLLVGKRKFSPIVWDKDDKKKPFSIVTSRIRDDSLPVELPPPPPLPHGLIPSNSIEIVRPYVEEDDQRQSNGQNPEQMEEEEEYPPPARNISASRWADGNNALEDDEAEAFDEEFVHKSRKNKPLDPTPELGEVIVREVSERTGFRPSNSGGKIGDEYRELEEYGSDYMDVGREHANQDVLLETESESEDCNVKTPTPPQRSINMMQGCRSVSEFERLNKINEGTYGVVYRAKDKRNGEIVALKKVKMDKEKEGFPLTSLREINILLSFQHPSIVDVKEVVLGSNLDSIFMVMEYMEHDLKGLMETMKQPFSHSEVKCLMLQLLSGIKHLHDNWVLHRDLKTSNLLLNNCGELKICDFGLSRQYGSPLKPYTHLVVTLWYRAPELLLGAREYSTAIDMWSLGCIMAELLAKEPLFSGKTEIDQLYNIFNTLGMPNEKVWPGFAKLPGVKSSVKQLYNKLRDKFPPTSFSGRPTLSEAGFDLLNKLLTYDPDKRITAETALNHDWFREVPLPKSKDFMPTFPAQHAQDRCMGRIMKSPDPLEEIRKGEVATGSLFG